MLTPATLAVSPGQKHCSKFPIYETEAANTSLSLYCEVSKFRLSLESKGKDSINDKHNPFTGL